MGPNSAKHLCAVLLTIVSVIVLTACGEVVSTGSFKGEQGNVARRISEFQNDATKSDNKTICHSDLAATIRNQLRSHGGDCQQVIKDQLAQIDGFTLSITSINISGDTATALVKSTYAGKTKPSTLELVKEGKTWKISRLS
jgi:Domain of unknown function (DUF4878)